MGVLEAEGVCWSVLGVLGVVSTCGLSTGRVSTGGVSTGGVV